MSGTIRYLKFLWRMLRATTDGSWRFYVWMAVLSAITLVGVNAWAHQVVLGMATTYKDDKTSYRVVNVRKDEYPDVKPGRYLVDDTGKAVYRTDLPIAQKYKEMDDGNDAPKEFTAPQPQLFANIIEGILGGKLEWTLIITGMLIAIALEMCGVSALPVAVGMYLSLASTMPIFIGGMLRLVADRMRGKSGPGAESETSPGLLLASGLIAGGTLCGLLISFFPLLTEGLTWLGGTADFTTMFDFGQRFFGEVNPETDKVEWNPDEGKWTKIAAVIAFGGLGALLLWIGGRRDKVE